MPKSGPRATTRYSDEFKAVAADLSQIPGVHVKDVAETLYIHPLMLSRWRKQLREGAIMSKGVTLSSGSEGRAQGAKGSGAKGSECTFSCE
jgi:transposase